MPDTIIVTPSPAVQVTVTAPTTTATSPSSVSVYTGTPGPTGPAGAAGSTGSTGATGAPGATGASGGSFVYTPADARTLYEISHNLGYQPNVMVIDSFGTEYFGTVVYTNTNSLTITFTSAVYATAYLS
jgi:hypothetical protein